MSCKEEEVTWLSSFGSAEVQKVGTVSKPASSIGLPLPPGNSGYTDHEESEDEKRILKMW